jgi:hypothetical protein
MRTAVASIVVLAAACAKHAAPAAPDAGSAVPASGAADPSRGRAPTCAPDPSFPEALDVAEASAATLVELRPGATELLVASDSDRKGEALAWTLPDGPARKLVLPLDPKTLDDVEGLAWRAGRLYVLVSNGFVEEMVPRGDGELARGGDAYALGAAPYVAAHPERAWGEPPDFEGLCLRPATSRARCAGYAASRAHGWLVCIDVDDRGHLHADTARPRLALDVKRGALSDCAFGAAGGPAEEVLVVATNVRGGSVVSRVDERTGALFAIDTPATMNDEAVAIDREGRLYQLMDADSTRSPALRATCAGWAP